MSTSTSHPLSRVLPNRPLGPMRSPARALGWFSIGLGLAELAMPRRMARVAGAPNLPTLTRAFGLREIGTGIGILTSKDPSPWLWGRVAGDALDVATVGAGLVTRGRPLRTLTSVAMSSASPATRPHSHGDGSFEVRMPIPVPISRRP